jgi:steroid Delta-isomerase
MTATIQRLHEVADYFEQLTADRLARLSHYYNAAATFKDPFNEVAGIASIEQIFDHMFRKLDGPRFVIRDRIVDGNDAFVTWDFVFRFKGGSTEQTVRGASHLRFDDSGLIAMHRDYWDAAEELYEKLPLLGTLMRWLKRTVNR